MSSTVFHPASIQLESLRLQSLSFSDHGQLAIIFGWSSPKTINKSPYRVKTLNHESISFFGKVVPNVSLASYYFLEAPLN